MIYFDGCRIDGCRKVIETEGDVPFHGSGIRARNVDDVGIDIGDNGSAYLSDVNISEARTAGARVANGNLVGHDLNLSGNRINLDLKRGARGDLFESVLEEADDFDLRYDQDVLFGLHDSSYETVHDLARSSTAPGIGQDPILDTTAEQLRAEWMLAQPKKFGPLASFLAGQFWP